LKLQVSSDQLQSLWLERFLGLIEWKFLHIGFKAHTSVICSEIILKTAGGGDWIWHAFGQYRTSCRFAMSQTHSVKTIFF